MTENHHLPLLAFLGPFGTYSYQAAYDRFRDTVEYCEKRTIADVFNSHTPISVVPQENSIYGSVTETYDLLRSPVAGRDKFVRGEMTLNVHHCLLVRRGVKMHEITKILSHEQALGQCRRFLRDNLPDVPLECTPSTALAATMVLSSDDAPTCAAICSKICATLFDGLEVLREGIQDENMNATRFYILTTHESVPTASLPSTLLSRALIRIDWEPSAKMNVGQLLAALGLHVSRVDRRPCLSQRLLFHSVYFVELEEPENSSGPGGHDALWLDEVKKAMGRLEKLGAETHLLGSWRS